ncbi:hypothetical protein LAZ67_17001978 [Cordylochernes scorpioides]|uniref:Acetyl-CoA hydrolase n=1 Tax=Cordylochernes scorpioides TaxID=51811 RepID=A0ABY6LHW8_9ARAC|nr:hypothetical protein LAZ67_17001978 [Cordylochernes scorpioides]
MCICVPCYHEGCVNTGDTVFLHGAAATPRKLIPAMVEHGKKANLKDVQVCHIHTEGPAEYTLPENAAHFRSNSFFTGANCRKSIAEGTGDFTPVFLSEIPLIFHRGIVRPDVAMVQVTPPDAHGFCSLGTSVDCTRAAIQHSKYIIGIMISSLLKSYKRSVCPGQVNSKMPRTVGDGLVHSSHFDALVEGEMDLPDHKPPVLSDVEKKIGQLIADNLVVDGATLQMGIGSIPDAVLSALMNHKDLGIHSEMFSDGVIDLVENGCVTNARKRIQPGKIVGSFSIGSKRFYDFMHNNPFVVMMAVDYVNDTMVICQNPNVTAINSCIEVDLTGQVVSDSIGPRIYSGVGGQIDFLRGAAMGLDGQGKPILAMPSSTKKGESKIVPYVKQGAGVVTSRNHIQYLVTEYGIASLFGKSIRQRAHALIQIAHPDHRDALEKAAFERLKCMPSP